MHAGLPWPSSGTSAGNPKELGLKEQQESMEQPRLLRGMHRHVEVEQQQRHEMWYCSKRPAQHEL